MMGGLASSSQEASTLTVFTSEYVQASNSIVVGSLDPGSYPLVP
jgi:hypothetical protein